MFRKKSVIKITFDPYHNLPQMKAKNCTKEQILDAGLFMQGHARIDCKNSGHNTSGRRRKKENRVHKFFRILGINPFRQSEVPSIEERRKNCNPSSARAILASGFGVKDGNDPR